MEGRKIIKLLISWIIAATIIGYSSFVLYGYIRGPRIIISNPESGFATTTPVIEITGQAIHASIITINDTESPSDLHGNFQSTLLLADGYNIMKVTAKDRYGRVAEQNIELTLLRTVGTMGTTTATTITN